MSHPIAHNETEFRRHVIAYAKDNGWRVHTDPDTKYRIGDPGFPDLVLARGIVEDILSPQFMKEGGTADIMFRELKMPGNYLSTDQWKWEQLLLAAGFNHSVWRPTDWERIERELK